MGAPFENLWTAVDGEADLINGGSWCAGPPSGARSTFWGLETELIPPYWAHIQTTIVGPSTTEEDELTQDQAWIERMDTVRPRNLHLAQRALRLGQDYADTGLEDTGLDPEPAPQSSCGCKSGDAAALGLLPLGLLVLRRRRRSG